MSTKESAIIAQFNDMAAQGLITPYELNWCVGAVRNRHELTKETRHQLRNTVHEIINTARARALKESK